MDESEEFWRKKLTPKQYHILREKGTELGFTGEYVHKKDDGTYNCAGCGQLLFTSEKKFDSKSGWPSFWDIASKDAVELKTDKKYGMNRVEVVCSNCGGHLGHVFDDGPKPTGKRYCINSVSLEFRENNDGKK